MKKHAEFSIKCGLTLFLWLVWWFVAKAYIPHAANLSVIFGGVLLTIPAAWIGRKILDRHATPAGINWTTTFVHFSFGLTLGIPLVRALVTHGGWNGWTLPVPEWIGLALVCITGAATLTTVASLALKGLGAPFFIALSKKVATDWTYAWCRNPMAFSSLSFLAALGIWFRSALFVAWGLLIFGPALVFFLKVYEQRELELRFGSTYLDYKARTPMLFPRRPRT